MIACNSVPNKIVELISVLVSMAIPGLIPDSINTDTSTVCHSSNNNYDVLRSVPLVFFHSWG